MTTRMLVGDCLDVLRTLDAGSVQCCVTSPPYFGLRDYGHAGQIGLEPTPDEYVAKLVAVFREVRRVLADDGTLWLNLGDSYTGSGKGGDEKRLAAHRGDGLYAIGDTARQAAVTSVTRRTFDLGAKQLLGIPWRVALALQADGWVLRSDIIWAKPNPMPESVTDRPTNAHEYLFLLAKSGRYYYDAEAIAEPCEKGAAGSTFDGGKTGVHQLNRSSKRERVESDTRNRRSVWTVATQPYSGAHFATFPPALIEPCILAGSRRGDTVLDPFGGAGTTGLVASRLSRNALLIELNPAYAQLARDRITDDAPLFSEVSA